MHCGSRSSLRGRVFASQVSGATSCAGLELFALHTSLGARLTGVGDTTGAWRRVNSAPLRTVAIIVVVGAMSLKEISTPKGFPTDLVRRN